MCIANLRHLFALLLVLLGSLLTNALELVFTALSGILKRAVAARAVVVVSIDDCYEEQYGGARNSDDPLLTTFTPTVAGAGAGAAST